MIASGLRQFACSVVGGKGVCRKIFRRG